MKISQVLSERKLLAIPFDGVTLNVVYKPKAITPETIDSFATIASGLGSSQADIEDIENRDMVAQLKAMASMSSMPVIQIVSLVESWDLTDEAGVIIPITTEHVKKLPVEFLKQVVAAINADINPNPTKRKPSSGTPPPTDA